ncbi:MAG TPA: MerR family transcriptional regulator [Egibacteraceae bacterium]|nr:MerR family transcriptional regulator [Egibacteraceae bacterium]
MADVMEWEQRLDDEDAPVYPIGVVAELLHVSVQVIRRYDEPDMVAPNRSDGGQRRYSRRDIARLARILELSEEGISAAGIRRILALEEELRSVKE